MPWKIKSLYYKVRRFWKQLKKAWLFAQIGFEDHDWDYAYLVRLIIIKLNIMADRFDSPDAVTLYSHRRALEMRALANRLENATNNFQSEAEMNENMRKALLIIKRRLMWWWD